MANKRTPNLGIADFAERMIAATSQVQQPAQALSLADGHLLVEGFDLAATGIASAENVTEAQLERFGEILRHLNKSTQWVLGDYVNLVCMKYGDERREQLAAYFDLSLKTIYEYAYVARRVEFSIRMENLSFAHHQAVAALEPSRQKEWLEYASSSNLSYKALLMALRGNDVESKQKLSTAAKKAKIAAEYVLNETSRPNWKGNQDVRNEVRKRAALLRDYYAGLVNECED